MNNLFITSYFQQHKDIHKFMREKPRIEEKSIIEYLLIEAENSKQIIDTRLTKGPEINSDHCLMVTSLKKGMEIYINIKSQCTMRQ